ncbi:MAG: AmmeMemoRadiSam system protein B, partial [Gammaproteobacteria bacterium]|nr:AmmeMemoRadiSam system protein B [Gammaproteobacteria bacterium]
MTTRKAFRAGSFYPADELSCRQQIEECLGDYRPPTEPEQVVSGIVPHAGWMFSGPTAAKVFKSVKEKASPETFLIFGAVHVWGVGKKASMFAEGVWQTPCGSIAIDEELAEAILQSASDNVVSDASAHSSEHSIEVQIPFIQYLFPEAKILPLMVTPE